MKQRITVEDLNTLSDKAKKKLRKWWKPAVGDVIYNVHAVGYRNDGIEVIADPSDDRSCWERISVDDIDDRFSLLPSIGQLIEFLYEPREDIEISGFGNRWHVEYGGWSSGGLGKEPCDLLWEEVKKVLEKR